MLSDVYGSLLAATRVPLARVGVVSEKPAAFVILAAGKGTRMKSSCPNVLHQIGHEDCIRVPCPAARMTMAAGFSLTTPTLAKGTRLSARIDPYTSKNLIRGGVVRALRPQDSNLDLTAPKAVVLPLH